MQTLFPPHPLTTIPISGDSRVFPVRRIFCVGRNYAEHAREMGATAQAEGREPPFFFSKPGDAVVSGEGEIAISYPPLTQNLHHEVEMVVALQHGGQNLTADAAKQLIFGYAVGLDLTRRDIQASAKAKGHPWDMGKGFDQSAVIAPLVPAATIGHPVSGAIWLDVNGQRRQSGDLSDMSWKVGDILAQLSQTIALAAGDLIYTGTPAGVGPLQRGDRIHAGIEGIGELHALILP